MADAKGIRSPGRDIYSVNFADYLPETLKRDPKMKALAAAVTEQMLGVSGEIDNVLIYSRIDELPEELIDILAFDMHVDWYDYYYPIEIKRAVVKNSVKVHKKLGTKYAVETALRCVYKNVGISEWFEYGAKPYYFKINLDTSGECFLESTFLDIISKVKFYKNLRSHCQGIYVKMNGRSAIIGTIAAGGVGAALKVKAKTADKIEAKETLHIVTVGEVGYRLKVKAKTADRIESKEVIRIMSLESAGSTIKVKATLPKQIQGQKNISVSAITQEENRLQIKARMPGKLKGGTTVKVIFKPKTGNSMMVKGEV